MNNLQRTAYGIRAYFRDGRKLPSKHFAFSKHNTVKECEDAARNWLKNARAYVVLGQPIPDQKGPRFQEDVEAYLQAVAAMPSISDRRRDMRLWASVFRGKTRNEITPLEIRTQLAIWRTSGYEPSTCNKRRTALMSFYTKLNGRSGFNPVRDVEPFPEDTADEPRAQHPVTIYRVLALMGPSKTRARLRVILTTGWPHAQVRKLRPEHLDFARARAWVTPRRKGKGHKGVWLPLLPAAITALRAFHQADAYGAFSHSSMYTSFQRAVRKLNARRATHNLPPLRIRPYDLRHTFGTWLAHRITDERAIQELMLHSRIEQQRRYNDAATAGRVERALATLQHFDAIPHKRTQEDYRNNSEGIQKDRIKPPAGG